MHYTNYHESKQRGTMDFPIDFYHVTPNHPQYHMRIHWHIEFEFIRVLEGTLHLTIDEQEFLIPENSVVFIPSGALHSGIPQNNCVYDCIVFDPNMLMNKSDSSSKLIRKIMNHDLDIQSIYDEANSTIHGIIWALFDAIASKVTGYQLVVQGTLYQFFGIAIGQNGQSELSLHTPRDIKRITQSKTALEFIRNKRKLMKGFRDIIDTFRTVYVLLRCNDLIQIVIVFAPIERRADGA